MLLIVDTPLHIVDAGDSFTEEVPTPMSFVTKDNNILYAHEERSDWHIGEGLQPAFLFSFEGMHSLPSSPPAQSSL